VSATSGLRLSVIPRARQPVVPWRNGNGTTREVAAEPRGARAGDAFVWRVSIARIDADGPFSRFPGVDRWLWLLHGAGVRLSIDGREVVLDSPLARAQFPGEAEVGARLLGGPTEDLNVMADRARCTVAAEVFLLARAAIRLQPARPGEQHVLLALAGRVVAGIAGQELTLGEGDALLVDELRGARAWEVRALDQATLAWAAFSLRGDGRG
jgi:environmental stress-induced protein Ves